MAEPLRLCLLAESSMSRWQLEAIRKLLDEQDVTISLIVVHHPRARTRKEKFDRAIQLREWTLVAGGLGLMRKLRGSHQLTESIPLDEIPELDGVEQIACTPEVINGWKYQIQPEIAEEVATKADIALLCGFGFITGPILAAPKHGVLSFHHGDLRKYRGQPMGFWEYLRGEQTAGVTLQRLTEKLDGGEIIYLNEVDISDARYLREVKTRLLAESVEMLSEGVRRVRDESFSPETPTELGQIYRIPKGKPVAKYLAKSILAAARLS
ncbi:formyltransferase family protein [Haladaptatus sp. DJG-WS-42]|uniref:formyltransferase family protein n=1 Tax=Haladaptatus sp. DJG-WS-42 TaxID=3120516 RepID=UPI0030D2012D